MQKNTQKISIEMVASFTCDMMKPYISWWLSKYNWLPSVDVLPFDQVHQTLIERGFDKTDNADFLVLLQRLEDYGRNVEKLSQIKEDIESGLIQYKQLIQSYSRNAKLMVGLFDLSDRMEKYGEEIQNYFKEANDEFAAFLFSLDNIIVLDFRNIKDDYLITREYDELAFKLGVLPFTDEYLISAATLVSRKIVAYSIAPHKVIVVDCDNTLWKGECANNTAEITSDYLIFQKYLLQKKNEGFLLAICSKNNSADVENFFATGENILSMSDFVACRINWDAKSENIRSMATELNLGLDSFVFFDDSAHECLEVMNALPQVLTLRFPSDSRAIGDYLKHIWALDKINVTAEDLVRTQLYQQERERKELSVSVISMDEYIEKLSMKVYISPIEEEDTDRATQLINRTNQFNLNSVRKNKEQLLSFLEGEGNAGYIVHCKDRYGDYGISGVILLSENEDGLVLDTFLLSCRVLGRRVENAVLSYLLSLCEKKGCKKLIAGYVDNGRNVPVKQFLENGFWNMHKDSDAKQNYCAGTDIADEVKKSLLNIEVLEERPVKESAKEKTEATFEHIGVAVSNIKEAADLYGNAGFHVGKIVTDSYQQASLCMCTRPGFPDIEFIEPTEENAFLRDLLEGNAFKPYHICLAVTNIEKTLSELAHRGIEYVEVSAPKPAVLFDMDRVMFIFIENVGIVEFRERKNLSSVSLGTNVQISYKTTDCSQAIKFLTVLGLSINEKTNNGVVMQGSGYPLLAFSETDTVTERYNIENILYESAFGLGEEFFANGTGNALKQKQAEERTCYEWEVLYDANDVGNSNVFRFALENHSARRLLQEYSQLPKEEEELTGDVCSDIYKLIGMIIGHGEPDIKKNFASNGGNSLQALSLLTKINSRYHLVASLEDVLLSDSLEAFVRKLTGGRADEQTYDKACKNEVSFEHLAEVERVPVTASQQRMYMYQVLNPESTAYNMPRCLYINGTFQIDRLQKAIERVLECNRGLRLNFGADGVVIYQYERDNYESPLKEYNSDKSTEELIADFIRPFNLSGELLLRVEVVHKAEGRTLFLFDVHHILVDGSSLASIINEILSVYNGKTIHTSEYDMMDYALYSSKTYGGDEEYWKKLYGESLPDTALPADSNLYSKNTFRGRKKLFTVENSVTENVYNIADGLGVSSNAVLFATYSFLIAKYTGEERVVISVPFSGRDRVESEDIVGLIIDTVPVCIDIDYNLETDEFIKYVNGVLVESYVHRHFPYECFGDSSFRLAYIMQNMDRLDFVSSNIYWDELKTDEFILSPIDFEEGSSKYDISFEVSEHAGEMKVSIEYCTDLFEERTIENLFGRFVKLCAKECTSESRKLKDISLVGDIEECILKGEQKKYEISTVVEGLVGIAEAYPDRIAVCDAENRKIYRELLAGAKNIAAYLVKSGVKKGDIVAVLADRSAEVAEMLFGVMMAGAAYLPLSKEYPESRIRKILSASGAKLVLSDAEVLQADVQEVLYGEAIVPVTGDTELPSLDENDRAYVIYTSGTTGEAKGVQILHKGILNYAMWRIENYGLTQEDSALELLPMSFDGFCSNFYSTLLSGGKLVMVDDNHWRDFEYAGKTIAAQKVTNISLLPTMYRGILENNAKEQLESLRLVVLAGEKTDRNLIKKNRQMTPDVVLVNEYGATENTVTTTANIGMDETNCDSVGGPIANNYVCVLDPFKNVLPSGMCGELAVWGRGLSSGYLNDKELTDRKFCPNPQLVKTGERLGNGTLYRTGDRVRINVNNQVSFIGRIDNQVKYRGFRIELSEIEQTALRIPGINAAVALVTDKDEKQKLCLYISGDDIPDSRKLEHFLRESLPPYMVPSYYSVVNSIPMTGNGKVDVKKLSDNELLLLGYGEKSLPESDTEQRLWNICTAILGNDDIGMNIGFISAGGQSLDVARLKKAIFDEFGVDFEMSFIFRADSLRKIAKAIEKEGTHQNDEIHHFEYDRMVPMSSAQKRIFLLEQIEDVGKSYHIPVFFKVSESLDIERLEKSLTEMVNNHEILRTTFDFVDGELVQIINDPHKVTLKKTDCLFEKIDYEAWSKKFELTQLPLFRTVLFGDNVLMFEFHHIIIDGASIKMFTEELAERYNGQSVQTSAYQYAEYVLNERECKKNKEKNREYWHGIFKNLPEALNYPTDYTRKEVVGHEGKCIVFKADEGLTKRIADCAASMNTTEFSLLLAAYNVMLSKISGAVDVVTGIPTLRRNNARYSDIQGIFINVLAIRSIIEGKLKVKDYVTKFSENLIGAYEHEDYPFEELVDELSISKVTNRKPLFDVMFVMRDFDKMRLPLEDCNCEVIDYMPDVAKYDFTLTVANDECVTFMLQYNTDLFEESTARGMLDKYLKVLEQMTEHPDEALEDISVISEDDEKDIEKYELGRKVPGDFESVIEAICRNASDRLPLTAVVSDGREVTYDELLAETKEIKAGFKALGIGSGDVVAIAMEPCVELIECALAIMWLGAAYLPLDVATPLAKIEYCVKDSKAKILIADEDNTIEVEGINTLTLSDIMKDADWNYSLGENNQTDSLPAGDDVAYIIYTSGTTGVPKGVMVTQSNLANYTGWFIRENKLNPGVSSALLSGFNFDLGYSVVYPTLAMAGTLHLPKKNDYLEKSTALKYIREQGIDYLKMTPTLFSFLFADCEEELGKLRLIVLGGESLNADEVNAFMNRYPGIEIMNHYGPTETTVGTVFKKLVPGMDIIHNMNPIIGRPIDNSAVYILDKNGKRVPYETQGEICVAGKGISKGYLNTAETGRFTGNPYSNEYDRIYKTGDYGYRLPSGEIVFVGRKDKQVKIHGYRVDINEIRQNLLEYEKIDAALVVVDESSGIEKRLLAFYISREDIPEKELRHFLRQRVAEYMIPAAFTKVDAFPMNKNGKLDMEKLLSLVCIRENVTDEKLSNNENIIKDIWAELLGRTDIMLDDNFFDVGGNSILLIKLQTLLKDKIGLDLRVVELFVHPTIRRLAALMEEQSPVADLEGLKVSEEWFDTSHNSIGTDSFYISLDDEKLQGIERLNQRFGISTDAVFTAVYAYIWNQITGENPQLPWKCCDGCIRIFDCDMDAVEDFDDLFKKAYEGLTSKAFADEVTFIKREDRLYFAGGMNGKGQIGNFDIFVGITEDENELKIPVHFDTNRVNSNNVRELLGQTGDVLEYILNSYS